MSDGVIIALISSAAAIISSLGLPKIFESFAKLKSEDKSSLKIELEEEKRKREELEVQLRDLQTKLSIIIPIVLRKNDDDPDVQELLRFLEKDTGINTTPA